MSFEKFKPEKYRNVNLRYTLRIPEKLRDRLATYSTKHNLSMNTLILTCIEYALENAEDEDEKKQKKKN